MLKQDSLYLTLPSNSNPDIFPNNKPQSFKVNFPTPIILEGKWKVGLTEIQYPNNWFNLNENTSFSIFFRKPLIFPEGQHVVIDRNEKNWVDKLLDNCKVASSAYYLDETEPSDDNEQIETKEDTLPKAKIETKLDELEETLRFKEYVVHIPAGNYSSLQALCDKIEEKIKNSLEARYLPADIDSTRPIRFTINDFGNVCIESKRSKVYIQVNGGNKLWEYLGWNDIANYNYIVPPVVAPKRGDLLVHHPAIFVYCDIVQHQVVGNMLAPLLRVVPIEGNPGEYIWRQIMKPMYLDVNKGYISTIEVELRDDSGNLIPFQVGKVLLVLELKRVSW